MNKERWNSQNNGASCRPVAACRRTASLWCLSVAVLFGAAPALADAVTQLGQLPITADSVVAGTFTGLASNPRITESAAGEWEPTSTITLTAPATFEFDTTVACVATIVSGDLTLLSNTATPTATTIQFTVNTASSAGNQTTIEFAPVWLRSTVQNCGAAAVGDRADITVTCSGGDNLNVATSVIDVSVTNGAAHHLAFTTQPANTPAGAPLTPAVTIQDQCNNTVTGDDRTITLSIVGGPPPPLLGTDNLLTVRICALTR